MTFSFASDETIAVVLLHKNEKGFEQPISFFTRALRNAELRYNLIEKHAYALIKSLTSFWVYILHSKVIAYVPNIAVKDVLVHLDIEGKRGTWIAKILEFDLEIRQTKLIKGQGLACLLAESNCKVLDVISNLQG